LKEIIGRLHDGARPDEVKGKLRTLIGSATHAEIMAMEQELMAEGMPAGALQGYAISTRRCCERYLCNWENVIKTTGILRSIVVSITLFVVALFAPTRASAHCDGMDGPVVRAAQRALESSNVNTILIWVQKKDEGEVRRAFEKTLTVRKLSPEAKGLADMYFWLYSSICG
jgi:hypothetical protein